MKTFQICLTYDATFSKVLTIEAENEETATHIALDLDDQDGFEPDDNYRSTYVSWAEEVTDAL